MLPTTVHLSVLDGSQAIDSLVFVEQECLAHLRFVAILLNAPTFFA